MLSGCTLKPCPLFLNIQNFWYSFLSSLQLASIDGRKKITGKAECICSTPYCMYSIYKLCQRQKIHRLLYSIHYSIYCFTKRIAKSSFVLDECRKMMISYFIQHMKYWSFLVHRISLHRSLLLWYQWLYTQIFETFPYFPQCWRSLSNKIHRSLMIKPYATLI